MNEIILGIVASVLLTLVGTIWGIVWGKIKDIKKEIGDRTEIKDIWKRIDLLNEGHLKQESDIREMNTEMKFLKEMLENQRTINHKMDEHLDRFTHEINRIDKTLTKIDTTMEGLKSVIEQLIK